MAAIFIFDYDPMATRKLCEVLRKQQYDVMICDGENKAPAAYENASLVILDARIKWTVCRPLFEQLQHQGTPVLFLTGDRSMIGHLRSLYAGKADVLTLPMSPKVLLSKVAELLKDQEELRELAVDETERVALLDGQRVELTAQEFALLLALMEAPDMPISREQLLRQAWGYQSMGDTRTVDVHVQRLRKKLGGERIETVYKCGYRLKMA